MHMGIFTGIFSSRDKPTNSINGNGYRFLFGGSTSGKSVNECINEMQDFIKDNKSTLTAFDKSLVKHWLKQITV